MQLQTLNPSIARQRRQIEHFLQANGLRYDDVDYYAAVVDDGTDEMVAGGGLKRNLIKCVAVADGYKGQAMANTIISHLVAHAHADGHQCVRLYTKPQNRRLFESMSFRLLAKAPEAILMETGIGGIDAYKDSLRRTAMHNAGAAVCHTKQSQTTGVIVMNANPFTLGHRHLIEQSANKVKRLYVIVVREDCSMFAYNERKAMIGRGIEGLDNVVLCDGSDYAVSQTTFPTYFLKRVDDAADTQMLLDLDLYCRHIAPALGAAVRFVGSEPSDPLTARYNQLMLQMPCGMREMPRLAMNGVPISASRVRRAIKANNLREAAQLVPPTTLPYIIGHLATHALQTELDTTPKPGLVDLHDSGAHHDMNHALMQNGIRALHPYFVRLALLGADNPAPTHAAISAIGVEAEHAMLNATRGVNTHKGALFALGLATVATASMDYAYTLSDNYKQNTLDILLGRIAELARLFPCAQGTHGNKAKDKARARLCGALDNARQGYTQLRDNWLPFYASLVERADPYALHKTLLRIMCDLDDTNIVYRTDLATMQGVKATARHLLDNFSEAALARTNTLFIRQNISPGGSADMLSLVVFLYGITRKL